MRLLLRKSSGNGIIWIVRLCHSTPQNLAFDPYSKLRVFIKKEPGPEERMRSDYPTHNEGRGIVYPASESDPNDAWWKLPDMQHVFMHEMGHCVQWMPKQGKYIMEGVQDCDRQGYQEGWPDAVKVSEQRIYSGYAKRRISGCYRQVLPESAE